MTFVRLCGYPYAFFASLIAGVPLINAPATYFAAIFTEALVVSHSRLSTAPAPAGLRLMVNCSSGEPNFSTFISTRAYIPTRGVLGPPLASLLMISFPPAFLAANIVCSFPWHSGAADRQIGLRHSL